MPYQPKQPDKFFRQLGLQAVERARLNREFTGTLADQAAQWVEQARHRQSMF